MKRSLALAAAAAAVLSFGLAAPASAHSPSPTPITISTAEKAPFNLAFTRNGRVLAADGILAKILSAREGGTLRDEVGSAEGTSGVDISRRALAYTTTVGGNESPITASGLNIRSLHGTRYVDTLAYETANNPDGSTWYGVQGYANRCVRHALTAAHIPVKYKGGIDSHAYSVAAYRNNSWLVADAGGNDILKVDRRGHISTVATLPAQSHKITWREARALSLPHCVVGTTYKFEAVPTDVEVGKDGYLYVSTLPGGPEGPVLGARGAVYKVNPWTGHNWKIASGFAGATNLALGKHGDIYVAEYFGDKISVIKNYRGHRVVRPYVTGLHNVVSVETNSRGVLYAGTTANLDPSAPVIDGTIVRIANRHAVPVS